MNKLFQLILSILIIFNRTKCSDYLIARELQDNNFGNDKIQNWDVHFAKDNQLISQCEKLSVFGGYNVFGKDVIAQKLFYSGVDHYQLKISFDLYLIDSWDKEIFYMFLDDILAYQKTSNIGESNGKIQINCGNQGINFEDRLVQVSVTIPHYKKQFRIKFASNLDEKSSNKSWGIRNFVIIALYLKENEKQLIDEEFISNGQNDQQDLFQQASSCLCGVFEYNDNVQQINAYWGLRDLIISYSSEYEMPQASPAFSPLSKPYPTGSCIQIFTQCGFQGEKLDICENIPNLKTIGWLYPVKSVYIPKEKYLKLYKQSNYEGDFIYLEYTDQCLNGETFILINKAFHIVNQQEIQGQQNTYLKRQRH
ncbi:zinc finger lsd1 subclass family protein, putative [Ichthyophthirius multifiliis]|uniref:Zinc finger lsd1 subclass family protein, putative n=1 Tax=Ichthyophthirius multifiliis TaxID=5932 RepID=G0QXL3_ICHMU|nr:zinc finger lsd1 subclass family protein, putative [Ichthyophthirius multifiliis]EGR30043.1 zinc finger lsd1 subclass family protein, putative [Ichthyophthirius multifiliis]|eukprot:XP_004031279.1 zinc finger lsd1 subclass family protein, putative [Ichthyophthirius multifiliis]